MRVSVDTSSPVPAYEQIRAQVEAMADTGALPAGTRLPPIRQLAADLGLAPGTVAKAYALLEKAGVTSTHRRRGTLITDRRALRSVDLGIAIASALARLYPGKFDVDKMQFLLRHKPTLEAIRAGKPLTEIKALW